jgi:hypothetical protein
VIGVLAGEHSVRPNVPTTHADHDNTTRRYRHLNCFQHEFYLEVRLPRFKIADGRMRMVVPDRAGTLSGFTLLFEVLLLRLCRQVPIATVAWLVCESKHCVHALCSLCVDLAGTEMDPRATTAPTMGGTSCRQGRGRPPNQRCLTAHSAWRSILEQETAGEPALDATHRIDERLPPSQQLQGRRVIACRTVRNQPRSRTPTKSILPDNPMRVCRQRRQPRES